jgi:hypothetical protein
MRRYAYLLLLALLSTSLIPYGGGDEFTPIAKRFVELLSEGEFSKATENFDGVMKKVLPPKKLKEVWESLVAQAGPFKGQIGARTEKTGKYEIVFVTCRFEKLTLDAKVVFNREKQISGLWFVPSRSHAEYKPPSYVDLESFREREVTVGTGEWALPGTLTIPTGDGPFPAVVLVHGSGPHDRDETIGPNKPFRDLTWGLASRGIAVLRYEKRTKVYAQKLASKKGDFTVKDETIEDALSAVSLLRRNEGIDAEGIFVLGHSLGGMLVPRIGALDPKIAGLIVMAGTTRPLEDVILDQMTYVFSLDGKISREETKQLERIKEQVAKVKDPNLSVDVPASELPFNTPASYWLDLRGYDPVEAAKDLKQPMLILQGGRDYQVTMEDFRRWREGLSSRGDVRFKIYPKLNHLFIEGEGKCTPAEYQRVGHVAEEVIEDISNWVKSIHGRKALIGD